MGNSLGGVSIFESSKTADRTTGEQRRAKCPVDVKFLDDTPPPALLGCTNCSEVTGLKTEQGLWQPPSGRDKLFWRTVAPEVS